MTSAITALQEVRLPVRRDTFVPKPRDPDVMAEVAAAVGELAKQRSRHDLARLLGVGTGTLAALLQKRVPEIETSARARAWSRTLARIAHFTNHNIRRWVEGYGLPWDDTLGEEAARHFDQVSTPAVSDPVLRAIELRSGGRVGADVRAEVAALYPFTPAQNRSDHSGARPQGPSFYDAYATRLLRTINPDWLVTTKSFIEIEPTINAMLERPDRLPVVFGLFDTIPRRQQQLAFVTVPGWRMPLSAVCRVATKFTWAQLSRREYRPLLIRGEAGDHFVRGECGYETTECDFVPGFDYPDIYRSFQEITAVSPNAVFVADYETCRQVLNVAAKDVDGKAYGMADPDYTVSYPIGIAVRVDAERFRSLIEAAQRELFRSVPQFLGELYAWVLYRKAIEHSTYGLQLEAFDEATVPFIEALVAKLHELIKEDRDISCSVQMLIPPAWHAVAARVLGVAPPPPDVQAMASASLHEIVNTINSSQLALAAGERVVVSR
jgi:hypothetical protein